MDGEGVMSENMCSYGRKMKVHFAIIVPCPDISNARIMTAILHFSTARYYYGCRMPMVHTYNPRYLGG
jgi:hypothetical protein